MDRIDADALPRWIEERAGSARRFVFGLAGSPGSGKSTLAERTAVDLGAVVVPMDGFHLRDAELGQRGLRDVKGAPHTFDADGFVDAVAGLASGIAVDLPLFDRVTDEPVDNALHVGSDNRIVIVEGNYLLLDASPWDRLVDMFDAVGHLAIDPEVRTGRLVARHVRHGKTPEHARAFVEHSDEVNAALVDSVAHRAHITVIGS